MKNVVGYWISKLSLERHPEGGYFVETYRSDTILNLPEYDGPRHACTAIYYLLVGEQFSSFHEMKSDEIWHFYTGSSMKLHIIEADGTLKEVILGTNIENGETFQASQGLGLRHPLRTPILMLWLVALYPQDLIVMIGS